MNAGSDCAMPATALPDRHSTVILLDISKSMKCTDVKPTRLHAAIDALKALIEAKARNYPEDRVGIVTFEYCVRTLQILANVRSLWRGFLIDADQIRTGDGTNMGHGLWTAGEMLLDVCNSDCRQSSQEGAEGRKHSEEPRTRQIVLMTDGEHNAGPDPVEVATELKAEGIVIDVIGCGVAEELDETCLRTVASPGPDGAPRYRYVVDRGSLIMEMSRLGRHDIRPM